MTADQVWLRMECHVAALYSYRIPEVNSFYALASPVPSPSAVKLSLVSSVIEATGDVDQGQRLFDAIRDAQVALAPPLRVAASRVLVKRLKKPKEAGAGFTTSFGIREYLHPEGPLTLWVQIPTSVQENALLAARHLRRIGTTDSVVYCIAHLHQAPDWSVCARPMNQVGLDPEAIRGRLVIPLNDLTPKAQLQHFAPAQAKSKASSALERNMYLLPLRVAKQGATWTLYQRAPFQEA